MSLKHGVEHAVVRAAMSALGLLSDGSRSRLGRGAGRLFRYVGKGRMRIARENLEHAFPDLNEEQIQEILRRCTEHFGTVFFDFLAASRLTADELLRRVEIEGERHYQSALDRGRGVFLLSAHFGNWEIGALAAGLLRNPIASVVRPLDNPGLNRDLDRSRGIFGNRTIAKKRGAREILRELRAGQAVAILIDQNVLAREAVYVPFFGRLAATSPAVGLLQLKTDAAVVPVFCRPKGNGHYRLCFESPILVADFSERERTAEVLTARYTLVVEAVVRSAPHQWLWMHNRWRTRPPRKLE